MDDTVIQKSAESLGMEPSAVAAVINEFMLQLHRAQYERNTEKQSDYLGCSQIGVLFRALPRRAFFHFLGFYEFMQRDQAEWERGYAHEFLMRLAPRVEWQAASDEMAGWTFGSYWKNR